MGQLQTRLGQLVDRKGIIDPEEHLIGELEDDIGNLNAALIFFIARNDRIDQRNVDERQNEQLYVYWSVAHQSGPVLPPHLAALYTPLPRKPSDTQPIEDKG